MAGHLARAGLLGAVYNRTFAKAERWQNTRDGVAKIKLGKTPAEAAEGMNAVALCVGNDNDVRECITGNSGVLKSLEKGSLIIDHTTASAKVAEEMAEACREVGVGFIDAPISGGEIGAVNGVLTVMCGGSTTDFERARPIFEPYSKTVTLLGGTGSGQRCKMVNQILCAGNMQAAAEALAFGERVGLDLEKVIAAVTKGAGNSWYLENRGDTMLAAKYDFGFAVDLLRKDLGIVKEEAQENQFPTPVTKLADSFFEKAQEVGCGSEDISTIFKVCKGPQ